MSPLSTSKGNLASLSGAHVLVTGGASGIGAALADACAAAGAGAVSLLDLDARGAGLAAALLREGNPGLFAAAFVCDVTIPEQVRLKRGERERERGRERKGERAGREKKERGMTLRGDRERGGGPARLFFSSSPLSKKKTWKKKKKKGFRRRPGRDRGPRSHLLPVRQRGDRALWAVPGGLREEERRREGARGCGSGGHLEEKDRSAALALAPGGAGGRWHRRSSVVPLAENHGRKLRRRSQRPPGGSPGDGSGREGARRRDGVHG